MEGGLPAPSTDKVDIENTRLWRITKTMLEMLADRVGASARGYWTFADDLQGYEVSESELNRTLQQFKDKYGGPEGEVIEYVCADRSPIQANKPQPQKTVAVLRTYPRDDRTPYSASDSQEPEPADDRRHHVC